MYNRTFFKKGALIIAAALITLSACHRKDNTTPVVTGLSTEDDKGGYASDAAALESHNNDVISIADVAASTGSSGLRTTSSCASITFDTAGSTHTLTINFGSTNCLCLDGKLRRGEIFVTYTGHYKDSGSTHTITTSNYFVNNIQLKAHKSVTNMGTNSHAQYYYTVAVADSIIWGADSITTWTGSRTRTWLTGYPTGDRSDDSYNIEGVTTITRPNGHSFTFTITTPLKVAYGCPYIESGVMTISSSSFIGGDRVLDYGSGACDNDATVTVGSHTYSITLH